MQIDNPLNASPLAFPILECIHIVGFAVSIGTIAYLGSHGAELLKTGWTTAQLEEFVKALARPGLAF